ncbi:MAG: hypothetical protein JXQ99_24635 [Hyphomicrobiaceae bacterium]
MWIAIDLMIGVILLIFVLAILTRVANRISDWRNVKNLDLIAPISVSGYENKDGNLGKKLAALLQARLMNVSEDIKSTSITLNIDTL